VGRRHHPIGATLQVLLILCLQIIVAVLILKLGRGLMGKVGSRGCQEDREKADSRRRLTLRAGPLALGAHIITRAAAREPLDGHWGNWGLVLHFFKQSLLYVA
jgi:hypothetical protein